MKVTTLTIALACCLGLVVAGCAEDADTDEPEDDGLVNDGPVNVNGSCAVKPYDCDDLGETATEQSVGCCFGDTHYYCDNLGHGWELTSADCETCAPKFSGEQITCKAIATTEHNPGSHPPETSRW